MKKIKLVFTYVFALLCIYVSSFNAIDNVYVNHISDNEDKIVIYTLKDDSLVPISLICEKENTIKENIELTFNLMKDCVNEFGFVSVIPRSVHLLDVNIIDELVSLNFNEAIYMMDSKYELRFIEAIVNSVLQYNDEYKIQFCVNGEVIDIMPLSNRKMIIFDKNLGLNNFKLNTNNLYQSDSKMVVEYIADSNYSYYVINSIRVDKEMELIQFVNMILNNISTEFFCENIEWEDDIMIIHLNESFLYDENTINKDNIMNLIYTLKVNEYSNKFMLKVNDEVKKVQDYKTDIITINDLYLNVFEQ